MKASQFNIFFQHEELQIGYNTYSNEFIVLDQLLYDMYAASTKRNSFDELCEVHSEFYDALCSQGFLVSAGLDEFEMIKQETMKIDNDDSVFELIVNPTMNCNFKCWYCYETHIKDSKMDEQTIAAIVSLSKNVIQHQKGLKNFILSFFGGEPLLYFNKVIVPILKEVSSFCKENGVDFSCGMTTNGLLINPEMLVICRDYGLKSFQITLDGNREQHDKVRFISEGRGSYDAIVHNIKLAAKHNLFVTIRVNCSVETMNNIHELIGDFNELNAEERNFIRFSLHKVWQEEANMEEILTETRFLFSNSGYSVSGVGGTQSGKVVLDSCYADKRYQATVNYNGDVFKCTARDFTSETREGVLTKEGEIIWNEKFEKRMNIKFKNAPCRECKILPLCSGGCSQQALEMEGNDYCVMGFDEEAKTQVAVNKFRAIVA